MILKKNKVVGNGRCLRQFESAVHVKIIDEENVFRGFFRGICRIEDALKCCVEL
jgi:hypothetical protein